LEYYNNEQKKLTDQEIKDVIDKEVKMSSLQTEEYIKKIKEKIKNLDVDRDKTKQTIKDPNYIQNGKDFFKDFKIDNTKIDSLTTNKILNLNTTIPK